MSNNYEIDKIQNIVSFVDIGAGHGDFSLYARQKFPDARIYALESNTEDFSVLINNCKNKNISCLRKNLDINSLQFDDMIKFFNIDFTKKNVIRINTVEALDAVMQYKDLLKEFYQINLHTYNLNQKDIQNINDFRLFMYKNRRLVVDKYNVEKNKPGYVIFRKERNKL